MIPTEEEKQKIQEAQLANPDVPLGSAEQFLLTLSSISELSARLQLWAFKMDYEATEKVSADWLKLQWNSLAQNSMFSHLLTASKESFSIVLKLRLCWIFPQAQHGRRKTYTQCAKYLSIFRGGRPNCFTQDQLALLGKKIILDRILKTF